MFLSGWVDGAGGGGVGWGWGGWGGGGVGKNIDPRRDMRDKQVSVYCTRINEYWQKQEQ